MRDGAQAKAWLIDHMPEWDKHFLPPSVSVTGASMFDDNIAFACAIPPPPASPLALLELALLELALLELA